MAQLKAKIKSISSYFRILSRADFIYLVNNQIAIKYRYLTVVMIFSMKKMYFKVIFLFMCNVRLANMMDVDQKCSNGQQITVIWWSQEPYVYTSEDHPNEDGHQDEQAKQEFSGMFPVILDNIFKRCCNGNTNLNYTKTPDGPASLDSLLAKQQFDLIIPVGAQAGALTVRRFPFAGILESPGVAVLIRGNVSGTQLLLSVLQGWPILVFILISASLAGVVIWLVVS